MPINIFFSWQADTPTSVGRNLIERALEHAAHRISTDADIEPAAREIVVDRDTKGVSGWVPIVDTIFRKIDGATVFVPDLTFVGKRLDGKPTPNPNVLIECGWALKSLGHGRIVPVMNTSFGGPTAENKPFNMLHLRNPIPFECPCDASDEARIKVRNELAKVLEGCIREVLVAYDFKNEPSQLEVKNLSRTLYVELADRVARCCFDCESPWHQYLATDVNAAWKMDAFRLKKFVPHDPGLFSSAATKIAILEAAAQQTLIQFYYRLSAWKRDIENAAAQSQNNPGGVAPGIVRLLARRIHQTLIPGLRALEALAPLVEGYEDIEKSAIAEYDQDRQSALAELSLRERVRILVEDSANSK